ncbi:transcription factor GTE4 isoform X3 [Abrus precatorius]|uniref:Transcription factor GTE4 isoform X3 n=1 Tax=Abrus precatorius TaxID=3816 RepID=A0A8B8KFW5_ABRPR|nr:transcription factor GTE4 isoform X3 [Abrus precatorius]XP_027342709.1 transcription factor GTE4 isoform X3 [Abrus precatorius]
MASGPIVGDDEAREKKRYTESKVYTRKAFKGPKNKGNVLNAVPLPPLPPPPPPPPSAAPSITTTTNGDNATATVASTTDNNKDNSTVENGNDGVKDNGNNVSVQPPAPVTVLEDGNSARPQENSSLEVLSDDTCSLNRRQDEPSSLHVEQDNSPGIRDSSPGNCAPEQGVENRVKISLATRSKQEMRELRRKLESELDMVRNLVNRIEEKQGLVHGFGNSSILVEHRIDNGDGAKCPHSEVASIALSREPTRPLNQLSVSVLENSQGVSEIVEKEKRTPKANQFYRNSEFLLAKDKFPPAESNKKSKLNGKKHGAGEMGHGHGMGSKLLKSCSSLLEKLMKHKHGWVFNAPVDVEGLGLHDYFTIITHPMDLGTVKSRLNQNWYKSPKEFAEDVRLTFRNAMTYNPKGQDVHVMAEQLSKLFEDRWAIIESNYNREMRYGLDYGPAIPTPSPLSRKAPAFRPPPIDMRWILDRSESMTQPPKILSITPSSRTPAPKKPKAKDPHKRDMTYEEKQKLSTNLQSLPSEKLDAIVQIIKKRNSALSQHDDEIEVDIDSVDAETLWELDRFVTNYKKSLSKNKRKAELAIQARARAEQNAQLKSQLPVMVEVQKETQTDERNVPSSMPVEGQIQVDNGSKTSSSSSSSSDSGSSSSDSDSDSSSSSGSDAGSQRT